MTCETKCGACEAIRVAILARGNGYGNLADMLIEEIDDSIKNRSNVSCCDMKTSVEFVKVQIKERSEIFGTEEV